MFIEKIITKKMEKIKKKNAVIKINFLAGSQTTKIFSDSLV
jgi:hypothetical protein